MVAMRSIGYSFLCSPHLDVQKLPKKVAHDFLLRVKNLCALKIACPVLVILIHPNADYAGKDVL